MNNISRMNDATAIESRLAARIAASLSVQAETLPHDVSERLRFGREQALARAQQARRTARQTAAQAQTTVVGVSASGAATLGRGFGGFDAVWPLWQRLASVLPLALLVAGLFMIEHQTAQEQVVAAAEFDSQLLADNLPPTAYSDPGFAEYLRTAPKP